MSGAGNGNGNGSSGAAQSPFNKPAPDGHARTTSAVLGEIVWLMTQSPLHKQMFIQDLEWLVMAPVLLQQFRLFYDSGDAKNAPKPVGALFWAEVDADVAARLANGVSR